MTFSCWGAQEFVYLVQTTLRFVMFLDALRCRRDGSHVNVAPPRHHSTLEML